MAPTDRDLLPHPREIPDEKLAWFIDTLERHHLGQPGDFECELLLGQMTLMLLAEDYSLEEYEKQYTIVTVGLILEQLRRQGGVEVVGEYRAWDAGVKWQLPG